MTQNPLDPDRIDLTLEVIGGESLTAIRGLVEQMSKVSALMGSITTSPEGQVMGAHNLAQVMRQGPGTVVGSGSVFGPASTPAVQDGHGKGASDPSRVMGRRTEEERDEQIMEREGGRGGIRRFMSNALKDGFNPGRALDQEIEFYGTTERQQSRRRGPGGGGNATNNPYNMLYSGHFGGVRGQGEGGVSSGASMPSNMVDPGDPLWRQALMSDSEAWENSQEGFRLPPGGLSLNAQDKFGIAADFFSRRAERQFVAAKPAADAEAAEAREEAVRMGYSVEEADSMVNNLNTGGQRAGRLAGGLRIAQQQVVAPLQLAHEMRLRGQQAASYGSGFTQAGIQAGADPGGLIGGEGGILGFSVRSPLGLFQEGSAIREGINQRINTFKLRARGGINGEQAQAITGGLAGRGWTGEQGERIAEKVIAPLVQQGQNPDIMNDAFDYLARNGNASMEDVVKTFNKLGPAADKANMSLDEYSQGIIEFAKVARENGAKGARGAQLGREVSEATGLTPQVSAELMENPLVKASALRMGVLPNAMGSMNANMTTTAIADAIEFAEGATAAANRPLYDKKTGTLVSSGRDQQDIQAAAAMNMSAEQYSMMRKKRNLIRKAGKAETLISNADKNRVDRDAHNREVEMTTGKYKKGDWIPAKEGDEGAVRVSKDRWAKKATSDAKVNSEYYDGEIKTSDPRATQAETNKALRNMMPRQGHHDYKKFDKQLDKIEKEKDGSKRTEMAREYVADRMGTKMGEPEGPTVYVEFTGTAKRLLKVDEKDRSGRQGKGRSSGSNLAPQDPNTRRALGAYGEAP